MDSAASTGIHLTESSPAATAPLPRTAAPTAAGVVALSRFVAANGMEPDVKDAYRARHRGHGYREPHCGIPKGLRLVGRETCIREFEVVCE